MKSQIQHRVSIFIAGAAILASIQSCNVMYSPSMQNTPLLQEKKEVVANVGLNDIQGAYAVTDHIGVMMNGYYNNGASNDYNNYDYYVRGIDRNGNKGILKRVPVFSTNSTTMSLWKYMEDLGMGIPQSKISAGIR